MIDGMFVADGVVHVLNLDPRGVVRDVATAGEALGLDAPLLRPNGPDLLRRMTGGVLNFEGVDIDALPPSLDGSVEGIGRALFEDAPNDIAMIGNIPFVANDAFVDPDYPLKLTYAVTQAYPQRTLLGGGADPLAHGLTAALETIEHQIRDLGARSMKFYTIGWSLDDEQLAYPMIQRCRDLGVDVIQVHKSIAFEHESIETHSPRDVQAAARDFPDMRFVIHHPMRLYFDELVSIAARFENVHIMMSPLVHFALLKPRLAQELTGMLLEQVGADKLIYGSEGPIAGNPTPWLEAFVRMEIPQDLRDGYGYPQITRTDKEQILGLNFARLFDIDVPAKQAELAALPAGR